MTFSQIEKLIDMETDCLSNDKKGFHYFSNVVEEEKKFFQFKTVNKCADKTSPINYLSYIYEIKKKFLQYITGQYGDELESLFKEVILRRKEIDDKFFESFARKLKYFRFMIILNESMLNESISYVEGDILTEVLKQKFGLKSIYMIFYL